MRKSFIAVLGLASLSALVAACEDKPSAPASAPPPSSSAVGSAAAIAPTMAPAAPKLSMDQMQVAANKVMTEALNKHDAKLYASVFATDGVVKVAGLPDRNGREAIEAGIQGLLTGFPDTKFAIARVWLKGSTEVAEFVFTGTNTGEFMGQKATGRPAGVNGVSVFVFNVEGLVVEQRRYLDTLTIASQLDPKAKPGSFRPIPAMPTATEMHVAKDDAGILDKANTFYAALDAHKEADVMAFATDGTSMDDYTQPAAAKGPKGFKEMFTTFVTAFPDLKQKNNLQIVADGYVISEGVLTGTHKGALGPIKASNKPVTIHYVDFIQIKEGKIGTSSTYSDGRELMVEIGAMPAPGSAPSASASAAASGAPASPAAPAAPKTPAK